MNRYKELSREEAEHFYNHLYRTISIGKDPYNDCYSFNKLEERGRSLEDCIRQYLNYYDGPVRFFVMDDPSSDIEKSYRIRRESKTMNKQLIRLTESDLHKIVKQSVNKILRESFFDKFKNTPSEMNDVTSEKPINHTYSVKELQWFYDNQDELTPIQRKVLNAAMWVRARKANYHGYVKEWPNITVKNGELFYYEKNGELARIPK